IESLAPSFLLVQAHGRLQETKRRVTRSVTRSLARHFYADPGVKNMLVSNEEDRKASFDKNASGVSSGGGGNGNLGPSSETAAPAFTFRASAFIHPTVGCSPDPAPLSKAPGEATSVATIHARPTEPHNVAFEPTKLQSIPIGAQSKPENGSVHPHLERRKSSRSKRRSNQESVWARLSRESGFTAAFKSLRTLQVAAFNEANCNNHNHNSLNDRSFSHARGLAQRPFSALVGSLRRPFSAGVQRPASAAPRTEGTADFRSPPQRSMSFRPSPRQPGPQLAFTRSASLGNDRGSERRRTYTGAEGEEEPYLGGLSPWGSQSLSWTAEGLWNIPISRENDGGGGGGSGGGGNGGGGSGGGGSGGGGNGGGGNGGGGNSGGGNSGGDGSGSSASANGGGGGPGPHPTTPPPPSLRKRFNNLSSSEPRVGVKDGGGTDESPSPLEKLRRAAHRIITGAITPRCTSARQRSGPNSSLRVDGGRGGAAAAAAANSAVGGGGGGGSSSGTVTTVSGNSKRAGGTGGTPDDACRTDSSRRHHIGAGGAGGRGEDGNKGKALGKFTSMGLLAVAAERFAAMNGKNSSRRPTVGDVPSADAAT
ncbi:hypothetical protein Vretimale_3453, partial [Volvox reticuliferus]